MLTQRDQDAAIVHRLIAAMFPESDERLGAMRMRAVIELFQVYAEEAHRARTDPYPYPCEELGHTPFCTHAQRES